LKPVHIPALGWWVGVRHEECSVVSWRPAATQMALTAERAVLLLQQTDGSLDFLVSAIRDVSSSL
jgi:hypothetical protein